MEKPKTPEEIAKIEKGRTISDAELLKNDAKYVVSPDNPLVLVATENQIESVRSQMEADMRSVRIAQYFESLNEDLANMERVGDQSSTNILKKRITADKKIIADAIFQEGTWRLIADNGIPYAEKQMNLDFLRREYQKDIEQREREYKEVNHLTWSPIFFAENINTVIKKDFGDDETVHERARKDGAKYMSNFLTSPVSKENNEKLRCNTKNFGVTANGDSEITKDIYEGVRLMLGSSVADISRERLQTIHLCYAPDGQISAVMLTLLGEYAPGDLYGHKEVRKRAEQQGVITDVTDGGWRILDKEKFNKIEEEVNAEKSLDPFSGCGSLIIKNTGKKMFLPDITYKQYPHTTENGRVIMPFAGGPCRGIFDEDVFFASERISSSGGNIYLDTSCPDCYRYDQHVTRDGSGVHFSYFGETPIIPKAHVVYNERYDMLIYKLDTHQTVNEEQRFNKFPLEVLGKDV